MILRGFSFVRDRKAKMGANYHFGPRPKQRAPTPYLRVNRQFFFWNQFSVGASHFLKVQSDSIFVAPNFRLR